MKNTAKKIAALILAVSMLATYAFALDEGNITLSAVANELSSGSYNVTYSASLVMPDDFAQAAAATINDDRLWNMSFSCVLDDALVRQFAADGATTADVEMVRNGGNIFTVDNVDVSGTTGITITCSLDDSLRASFATKSASDLFAEFKKEIKITETRVVAANRVEAALAVADPVPVTAAVTITGDFGSYVMPAGNIAASGTTNLVINAYSPAPGAPQGSTSGSVSDAKKEYTIKVENAANGSASANYNKAEKGAIITVTASPAEGYRVTALTVKTNSGVDVAVVKKNENVFTFYMPADGVKISSEFAPAIADPEETGVGVNLVVDDHIAFMNGYPQGDFRPNNNITRAEVCQMFYNLMKDKDYENAAAFADVDQNQWYAAAINKLFDMKIVNGVSATEFQPNRAITRAEFAAIVARFATATKNGFDFADVSVDHWAYNYISTAAGYGWIKGVGDNKFEPNRPITRAEAATLVNHMLGRLTDEKAIDEGAAKAWADVSDSHWARYEISEATNAHGHSFNEDRTVETWTEDTTAEDTTVVE